MKTLDCLIVIGALCCVALSCARAELDAPGDHRADRSNYDLYPRDSSSVPDTITAALPDSLLASPADSLTEGVADTAPQVDIYYCGVELPPNVDWTSDAGVFKVSSSLVLFKNGERILTLEAGLPGFVSSDPSTHYIAGGNLYSMSTADNKSVLYINGEELLNFKGKRYLSNLTLHDGEVYSLIQASDRKSAVIYRGADRLYDFKGENPGPIHFNADSWCCIHPEKKLGKTIWNTIVNGRERSITFNKEYQVFDVRQLGGEAVAIVTDDDYCSYLVHELGDKDRFPARGYQIVSARFIPADFCSAFCGTMENIDNGNLLDFCLHDDILESCPHGERILSFYGGDDSIGWASCSSDLTLSVSGGGKFWTIPDCGIVSERCITTYGGSVYAVFADMSGNKNPVFWKDGVSQEIPLHGYMTAVEVVPRE